MNERLARARAGYDAVAADYAALLPDASFEAGMDLAMIEQFVDQLPAGARVLDAGCGTGRMLGHLHERESSLRLVGIDLSSGMLAEAARRTVPTALVGADLAALPFDRDVFDGVLAWYSIIHVPYGALAAVVAEMARVLRPGGALLLGFHAGTGERTITSAYGQPVELTAFLHLTTDVTAAARAAGLDVDTVLDRAPRPTEKHDQGFVLAQAPK
ncbi:class I SAM-dependent DNA methyltransferase [Oerskovia enterophila]|uniref:class I SAM-dependent DNA methyltransferase n=1 Tax=Oerskovia enterophila TaxID=43678 RepID=UPI00339B234D